MKVNWDVARSAADNAKRHLPPLASKYFAAGKKALKGKPAAGRVEKFLKKTARFRSALENLRPLYGPAFARRLKEIEAIEEGLNELRRTAALRGYAADDKGMRAKIAEAEAEAWRALRKPWDKTFGAPRALEGWKACLARPNRPRAR